MVTIKDINLVEEIEDAVEEVIEDDLDDSDDKLVEGRIFDEDLDFLNEPSSDFDIGSTMLGSASSVKSWAGQNLEEKLSREHIEKDWGDDEEFVGTDVYKPSEDDRDIYGAKGDDTYGAKSDDIYNASGSNDLYGSSGGGDVYNSEKSKDGYSVQMKSISSLKSHGQVDDERRGGSMLESMGFEDKKKRSHDKFSNAFVSRGSKDEG